LLLDNSTTFESEKFAVPNNNSIRGFNVLDAIKETLETVCPQTVSCADIVTIAARDSVALVGGKGWPVVLGRRDSLTSHFDLANASDGTGLPSPFVSLDATFANFALRNFSQAETITLSGAHTFGRAHCITFTGRFNDTRPFNLTDTNVNPILKKEILEVCPPNDTTTVIDLDVTTPNIFDNAYYKNLGYELGVLHTDQNRRFLQWIYNLRYDLKPLLVIRSGYYIQDVDPAKHSLLQTESEPPTTFKADLL
jgi:peroxidase